MSLKSSRARQHVLTHTVLWIGCLIFSVPFFWLVTTSFKADKEMFVLPPEWLPEIPDRVVASPYPYTWRGRTTTQFFGLGAITMQDMALSDFPVPNSATSWRVVEGVSAASVDSFESQPLTAIPYDFHESDRFVIEASVISPLPLRELRRTEVTFKSDRSFHRLNVEIVTAENVWESVEPAVLSTETWKSAPFQFTRPRQEERAALRLQRVDPSADGRSNALEQDDRVTIRLTLERSSWLWAIWRKYADNYIDALGYIPFGRFLFNTVVLTALNIAFQLLSCSLVAYGFSRIRWPGRNVAFAVLLATMMIPGQVVMIPQFLIWRGLGLYNTWGPLFLGSLFGSGFFIFLLRQFMLAVPTDLEDAAKIDGAGYFSVWRRVMIPLIRPALAAIAIFQFMGTWNDFFGPLLYINSKELMPISLGLYMFKSSHGAEYGMLMAASLLMLVPVVALFFFAQRYFIQGVTLTGMKG
jgi:multiple sugar transport system permease protein